jgi:predicted flap endonuclease-1-like 5' DNA nuclease
MPSERSERAPMDSPAAASRDQPSSIRPSAAPNGTGPSVQARRLDESGAMSLHVSKLRGISLDVRRKLKRQGISYTHQLLREAGGVAQRRRLAERSQIDEAALLRLVRRADLARIKGVGAIFADMLEMIGVNQVATLAEQDPLALRARLHQLNAAERLARRAPTPDEVQEWISQARALPRLVDAA